MKTTIFYFSGTGNSLKVSMDIAGELGDTIIMPIPSLLNKSFNIDSDCIGIVFPVHMWGIPGIVKEFISKIVTEKYVFAVITYGVLPGSTLLQTRKLLKKQNTILCSGFKIRMPDNAIMIYNAFPIEKQRKLFDSEILKVKEISKAIEDRRTEYIEKDPFLVNWLASGILHKRFTKKIIGADHSFWTDDKCKGCGICAKICPVNNIKITNGSPKWLHNCQFCMACLQWCPKEAIQYKNKSIHRTRYRNPDVQISDFISNKDE